MAAALWFVRAGNPLYTKYHQDTPTIVAAAGFHVVAMKARNGIRACGAPIMRADKLDAILDHFFSTRLRSRPHIKTLPMNYDTAVVGKEQIKRMAQLERNIEQREKERERVRLCSASGSTLRTSL